MNPDVVIVGGGPAGAACALALAKGGVSCALFERSASPRWKAGEIIDARAQSPLRELGVWEQFAARGYLRSAGTVSSWGAGVAEKSSATSAYAGSFLVERAEVEAMLLAAAAAAGATVVRGAHVAAARREAGRWSLSVRLADTQLAVTTPLLVEAVGRGRSVVGAGARARVDSLTALVAYPDAAEGEPPDLRFAVEAAEQGWWYAAALPAGKTVLAFLTDADMLPAGRLAREQFFRRQAQSSSLIGERLDAKSLADELRVAPAMSTIRRTLCGDSWVALGDAAATYDPLTGMGVMTALTKGLALARLLLRESPAAAVTKYAQAERAAFDDYLEIRRSVYGAVRRWADAPFWLRRAETPRLRYDEPSACDTVRGHTGGH